MSDIEKLARENAELKELLRLTCAWIGEVSYDAVLANLDKIKRIQEILNDTQPQGEKDE